ncbi:LysR family transcriptional regulator [Pseudobacteroides cellulosolvens]|uniref:Transcriptional regulator, LysR family n=1 Tax=Pseudobacteroides cellulosolvens ATCC 35603 = DSM 2933 TaxID=398512 RepID=A0A0L6JSM9_9FIRM|nr:LysR family transcriptional regulator [Pseudobacteroides cellulosolvens]KNY28432.1 transcriptional regulator, LysR family [Pseudobacteroides cellulosolvens ATCC 35603 = DSM 2933]
MDVNFELYKIFYLAAKSESFSSASRKLFISQSAVSQSVKHLEDKLGAKLFTRKGKQMVLTNEGVLLLTHVEQAYNFIKTAEHKILEIQNMDAGEIRIGASDTVCRYHLVPYLEKFNTLYPKIKIHVINRTSSQILNLLKNGIVDFGIVTLPVEDDDISVSEFMNVQDIFVASDKYSDLMNISIDLRDITCYPLLMLEKNSSTRRNLDIYFRSIGVLITPEIELESVDLLVDFAKIGLGVACVLKESAMDALCKKEIFEVQTKEKLPERKLGIISMKSVPLSKASTKFMEFIPNR